MSKIDWTKMITAEMKADRTKTENLVHLQTEADRLRKIADYAIAPLQDAVDTDDATAADEAALKLWKKYRVALSRLPDQPGYPVNIDWPPVPA